MCNAYLTTKKTTEIKNEDTLTAKKNNKTRAGTWNLCRRLLATYIDHLLLSSGFLMLLQPNGCSLHSGRLVDIFFPSLEDKHFMVYLIFFFISSLKTGNFDKLKTKSYKACFSLFKQTSLKP